MGCYPVRCGLYYKADYFHSKLYHNDNDWVCSCSEHYVLYQPPSEFTGPAQEVKKSFYLYVNTVEPICTRSTFIL